MEAINTGGMYHGVYRQSVDDIAEWIFDHGERMSFDELLNQYPPEEWVESEEEDGYCATCRNGTICREAITMDVVDICTEAGVLPLHCDTICLQWLTDNNQSSLKTSITELAAQFNCFLAERAAA